MNNGILCEEHDLYEAILRCEALSDNKYKELQNGALAAYRFYDKNIKKSVLERYAFDE